MNKEKFFFTSESVTEGHPDKVADAISDSILDAIIGEDKSARVACETLITTGLAFIAGEINHGLLCGYSPSRQGNHSGNRLQLFTHGL